MRQLSVEFPTADGEPLRGFLRLPEYSDGPFPAVVHGPGWMGLKDAGLYETYHQAFVEAGLAVLVFDYRGFGDSGGDPTRLSPVRQLEDLRAAVDFLDRHAGIDRAQLACFGTGGTGGGNAVMLLAADDRVNCAISQVPVADGRDWLRRMRSTEEEWRAFIERIELDRRRRAETGAGELVHPREEIMLPSAERRSTQVKGDVDDRVPTAVSLSAADEILAYRPIEAAPHATGLMIVAVAEDDVTPTSHAQALYDAAPAPKRLVMQYGTSHYAAYGQYQDQVIPRMVDWFERHIAGSATSGRRADG